MPLEEDRIWSPDVVVGFNEMLDILNSFRPLVPLPATTPGETAMRYTFADRARPRRSRHHRPCFQSFLRSMQSNPPHLRRQDPHLPLLPIRPRSLRRPQTRRHRRRSRRLHRKDNREKRSPPPHRRTRLSQAFQKHGPHRRLKDPSLLIGWNFTRGLIAGN